MIQQNRVTSIKPRLHWANTWIIWIISGIVALSVSRAQGTEIEIPRTENERSHTNLLVDTRIPAVRGPRALDPLLLDVTRAGSRIVAVGELGIILLSDDEGVTWRQADVPAQVLLTAVAFADALIARGLGKFSALLKLAPLVGKRAKSIRARARGEG